MSGADMTAQCTSAAWRIASFAHEFGHHSTEPRILDKCARTLADTVAVAIAGRHETAPAAARRYLAGAGLLSAASYEAQPAWLWGEATTASPEISAWYNGLLGHALDYDDVTVPLRGHPSVVLWPPLLALAQSRDVSGERVMNAYLVGFEVICKLARVIALRHYAKGWHSTASIGTLGAAVACAHLIGLEPAGIVNAIGLAVAQAAGSRENVGTHAKSFQAGHACAAGVRAACLAETGFEAGPGALDGPHGYMNLYAEREDLDSLLASLGQPDLEIDIAGTDLKQYPMCYAAHRAIDAVLDMRQDHDLTIDDVSHVHVVGSHEAFIPLVHSSPQTGLEGKFSLPYAMAAAIADGAVVLSSFTDDAVQRPDVQSFFSRITFEEASGAANPRWAEVIVQLRDGTTLRRRVQTLRGSHQNPVTDNALIAKLDDCLRWGRGPAVGGQLLDLCRSLPGSGAQSFMRTLANLLC